MLQLPLNIQLDDSATFNNYFVGNNNQLYHRLISLIERSSDFIFIWGTSDSGKTHLAQALCHQFDMSGKLTAYLPLNNPDIKVEILDGMNHLDLVCLDQVNAVEGDPKWEESLFNLYNNLKNENKNLVIFSEHSPNHSLTQLADLKSRFSAMEIYKLQSLDSQQKLDFFKQRATNRGINISDDAVKFILSRKSRSISDLVTMLEQIDHSSIVLKRKVTIPLIKQIFNI